MDIDSQTQGEGTPKAEVEVNFYTRSEDPHNRQMVATMTTGEEYRFSEDQMWDEFVGYALPKSTLLEIESAAFNKAQIYNQGKRGKEWPTVQKLLIEFQRELETLYGYLNG